MCYYALTLKFVSYILARIVLWYFRALLYSARGYFPIKFSGQKHYTITVDVILIHFKKILARVWVLIGPKEGSKPNFSILFLAVPILMKKFREK